jgi:hypothetical protein
VRVAQSRGRARIQIRIPNLKPRDLFACKWLRAPDLNQRLYVLVQGTESRVRISFRSRSSPNPCLPSS